jgi:hypothetical protein
MSTETEVYNKHLKGITEAYSKSKSWEDVINTALQETVAKYEKKNGTIKPIPKK